MRADEVLSYGLAWNPLKSGHVLGASEDTTVCHWYVYRACSTVAAHPSTRDVNSYTKEKSSIEPTNVFRGHTSIVGVGLILFISYAQSQGFCHRMLIGIAPKKIFLVVSGTTRCY